MCGKDFAGKRDAYPPFSLLFLSGSKFVREDFESDRNVASPLRELLFTSETSSENLCAFASLREDFCGRDFAGKRDAYLSFFSSVPSRFKICAGVSGGVGALR